MTEEYCMVLTTTASEQEAEVLAKRLVSARLAACVQVQKIKSFYMWQGEACSEPESLLMIKSKASLFESIRDFIQQNHNYETPEIISVPVQQGLDSYLRWIDAETGR